MQQVATLHDASHVLNSLAKCATSGSVRKAADVHAEIKGFNVVFQKLRKDPDLIRLLLQHEFGFDGVINAYAKGMDAKSLERVLAAEWYDSTFVIPHYSSVKYWVKKCVSERNKGKTVVCLIPSRTNTAWFHDLVINQATQVRFIQGRITMPGFDKQSPFPDAIAIYLPRSAEDALGASAGAASASSAPDVSARATGSVAILACKTNFTDDNTDFSVVEDDDEGAAAEAAAAAAGARDKDDEGDEGDEGDEDDEDRRPTRATKRPRRQARK